MKAYRVDPKGEVNNPTLFFKEKEMWWVYVLGWYGDDCELREVEYELGDVKAIRTENVQVAVDSRGIVCATIDVTTVWLNKVIDAKLIGNVSWKDADQILIRSLDEMIVNIKENLKKHEDSIQTNTSS